MLRASNSSGLLVEQIVPPLSFVFVCLSFCIGTICIVGNMLAMIVMVRSKDTTFSTKLASTWILFHLALSAFCIGLWAMVCGTHLLTEETRRNIWIDHVRRFLGILAPCALIMLLGCISYDRYILLKHHTNHNKYMTAKRTRLLVTLCWVLPVPILLLRYLSETSFYLLVVGAILTVFVVLITSYSFILKLVFESERKVKSSIHYNQNNSLTDLTSHEDGDHDNSMEETPQVTTKHVHNKKPRLKIVNDFTRLKKTLRLAKTVSKLLTTYMVFHLPMVCYLMTRVIKRGPMTKTLEIALLLVEIFSQINASLVPLVYFTSISAYKKGIKKLLHFKQ